MYRGKKDWFNRIDFFDDRTLKRNNEWRIFMENFQEKLAQLPTEIKRAWSVGFVFVKENDHYWHFPARQWSEQQIQDYFLDRFGKTSTFKLYPELKLKHLIVNDMPALLVVVPYEPRKESI